MHFATPSAFFLLPLLAGLWWLSQRHGKARQGALDYSDVSLVRLAGAVRPAWENHLPMALSAMSLVCLLAALARPQSGLARQWVQNNGIDIMMCLDTSGSMKAQDLVPSRMAAAAEVSRQFVQARPDDRIGLVVFAGSAYTQCPLTTDHSALQTALSNTRVGMTQTDGTAIGSAIATGINRLKDVPGKSKVLILLTDGSNNAGEITPAAAAELAARHGIKIYAIGMGTNGPAPMTIEDPLMGERTVMVRGDLDEASLQQIADSSGGKFFRATDNQALESVYAEINRLEKRSLPQAQRVDYHEIYGWFLWPATLFLGLKVLLERTLLKELI